MVVHTQVLASTMYDRPRLLAFPVVVLVLCLALGIFGVLRAAGDVRRENRTLALKLAIAKAGDLGNSLKVNRGCCLQLLVQSTNMDDGGGWHVLACTACPDACF